MVINENFLLEKYEQHFLEFRLKLLKELHEEFFEKYVYIQAENGTVQGYIKTIDFNRNEFTHETELRLETIDNSSGMSYTIAVNQIKRMFYADTKEQTLLEVECTEE